MLQKLLIPPGVLLIEVLCVEEERLCRHQAGCLQLLNYNLGTQVNQAAHHLQTFPFPLLQALSPATDILCWCPWPLLPFGKHCLYSCCLASFLLMEINDWWHQGRSPYRSYRHIGVHIGDMHCSEESCRDSVEEDTECPLQMRWLLAAQVWSKAGPHKLACHSQAQLCSKGK